MTHSGTTCGTRALSFASHHHQARLQPGSTPLRRMMNSSDQFPTPGRSDPYIIFVVAITCCKTGFPPVRIGSSSAFARSRGFTGNGERQPPVVTAEHPPLLSISTRTRTWTSGNLGRSTSCLGAILPKAKRNREMTGSGGERTGNGASFSPCSTVQQPGRRNFRMEHQVFRPRLPNLTNKIQSLDGQVAAGHPSRLQALESHRQEGPLR
ncbi:hypothetical protein BJ322DRAFT_137250 [Thelephora terrestris]|uniref:Uncharacterized protein n=1 Tax=Thelephora terrestris TaxID=56493 RepID=A0A9P6HB40_9AGAM|nr:hypothetical protein BJ322DRAFT_137250 [Thelephora terrestris]